MFVMASNSAKFFIHNNILDKLQVAFRKMI